MNNPPRIEIDLDAFRRDFLILVQSSKDDSDRWFPSTSDDLVHQALGLCGEAGEVGNKIKKLDRGSLTFGDAYSAIRDELADVLVYWLTISQAVQGDPIMDYLKKREFNERRFKND